MRSFDVSRMAPKNDNSAQHPLTDKMKGLVAKTLTIQLVGPKGDIEKIRKKTKMQTHLQARTHVVYQWLSVLQHVHPLYKDDPKLQLGHFDSFRKFINTCNTAAVETAIAVTNKSVRDADKVIGDDVAQIGSGLLSKTEAENLQRAEKEHCSTCPSHAHQMNVSCSLLIDKNAKQKRSSDDKTTGKPAQNGGDNNNHLPPNTNPPPDDDNLDDQNILDFLLLAAEAFNVTIPKKETVKTDLEGSKKKKKKTKRQAAPIKKTPSDYQHVTNTAWESRREDDPQMNSRKCTISWSVPSLMCFFLENLTLPAAPCPARKNWSTCSCNAQLQQLHVVSFSSIYLIANRVTQFSKTLLSGLERILLLSKHVPN